MSDTTLHILVGVDFSESSPMAVAHAVKLVERTQGRLHIAHIAPASGVDAPLNLGMNIPDEFPEAKDARVRLEHVRATLGTSLDTELHVRIGTPLEGLLTLIKELKPDMVVVCSHGKGLLSRTLMGSVSNRLVELSPVPVLVVPTPGRETALTEAVEPPKEPELPSVGRAVAEYHSPQTADGGIAGTGGIAT
jgi:nucleotide-binding universal stress UspA family protein